jgi:hypothetical protein
MIKQQDTDRVAASPACVVDIGNDQFERLRWDKGRFKIAHYCAHPATAVSKNAIRRRWWQPGIRSARHRHRSHDSQPSPFGVWLVPSFLI